MIVTSVKRRRATAPMKVIDSFVDKGLVEEADNKIGVRYGFDTSYGVRYANLSNRVIDAQFSVINDFAEINRFYLYYTSIYLAFNSATFSSYAVFCFC